jgi:hypothetical protein
VGTGYLKKQGIHLANLGRLFPVTAVFLVALTKGDRTPSPREVPGEQQEQRCCSLPEEYLWGCARHSC